MEELASLYGKDVVGLINFNSKAFKSTGRDPGQLTPKDAGELIMENPRAMHRPLFTDGNTLVVGFKPEEMERLIP